MRAITKREASQLVVTFALFLLQNCGSASDGSVGGKPIGSSTTATVTQPGTPTIGVPVGVSITSPADAATVLGMVTVQFGFTGTVQPHHVELFGGEAGPWAVGSTPPAPRLIGYSSTSPFQIDWITTNGSDPNGFRVLTVHACGAADCSTNFVKASITVTIQNPAHTLTVAVSGYGTVTSSSPTISCILTPTITGGTCVNSSIEGTNVVLTPTPDTGYGFCSWRGSTIESGSFVMPGTDVQMIANFGPMNKNGTNCPL